MRQFLLAGCAVLGLSACVHTEVSKVEAPAISPQEALRSYYATFSDSQLPTASFSPKLAADKLVQRVIVASCINEEKDLSSIATMAAEKADLTLLIGDNVYGDMDMVRNFVNNEADLAELRSSYQELADDENFIALRKARPMLATWDDHDYGANDAGSEFPFKEFAERIFERFFDVDEEVAERPGVYSSTISGPDGQRLQIILTDTRFFRSELTPTDDRGAKGKERYLPSTDPQQDMLGEAQWSWLEEELRKPADLRLLVSSIQVIPTVHGWEAWSTMPKERERLYKLLAKTEAKNTIFVSGDRHTSYLYKEEIDGVGPVYELTSSSVNSVFARTAISDEYDTNQIGDGYTFANYGAIDIDWDKSTVKLSIIDENGQQVSGQNVEF